MIQVHAFVFNPVQENTYVVYDESGDCAIIDAGCFTEKEFKHLDQYISDQKLKPVKLINTHCHFDHILGVQKCRESYGLQWEAHKGDAFLVDSAPSQGAMFGMEIQAIRPADVVIEADEYIRFGSINFRAIHVPGHSPGSICLYDEEHQVLFAGDVLFKGSIGRTDLPQGDYQSLIDGIKTKLMSLPDQVVVYPGHGPSTTIGDEKAMNPFLQ